MGDRLTVVKKEELVSQTCTVCGRRRKTSAIGLCSGCRQKQIKREVRQKKKLKANDFWFRIPVPVLIEWDDLQTGHPDVFPSSVIFNPMG